MKCRLTLIVGMISSPVLTKRDIIEYFNVLAIRQATRLPPLCKWYYQPNCKN